jgi:hypothetical protein
MEIKARKIGKVTVNRERQASSEQASSEPQADEQASVSKAVSKQ